MIKKLVPCPWCGELVEGVRWPGGGVIIYEHKGNSDEIRCHFRLVLERPVSKVGDGR